jgi:hypothetical protein
MRSMPRYAASGTQTPRSDRPSERARSKRRSARLSADAQLSSRYSETNIPTVTIAAVRIIVSTSIA